MIDPATGWCEIHEFDDKQPDTIANLVEEQWLTRYPIPDLITFDKGKEFIGVAFQNELIQDEYGIKIKPATTANPQSNAIIERIHQTVGNMLRTFELDEMELDEEHPFEGILSATAFAVRSTYHTTLQATPGQLVFGRDMILNIGHIANWKAIAERKQKIINRNNERENKRRLDHFYQVGDQVMVAPLTTIQPKLRPKFKGPYEITNVGPPGEVDRAYVTVRMGTVEKKLNIRHLKPYHG